MAQYDLPDWIEKNKDDFKPPVCNKCMYNDQLKVFLIGGPNTRKDFHLEEGEEFFFQFKGDMCLPVVEKGKLKNVDIKEGHVFMLPPRTLHSPQRLANTVGLVVERTRAPWEMDSLRYHVDDTTDVLFERWVKLNDIVKDLPPIMKEFSKSEANRTGRPTPDSIVENRPFEPDRTVHVDEPLLLNDWIRKNAQAISAHGYLQLYGPPKFTTQVIVYGHGQHEISAKNGETFFYQFTGSSAATMNGKTYHLPSNNTFLIPIGVKCSINISENGYAFTVFMETPTKIPKDI